MTVAERCKFTPSARMSVVTRMRKSPRPLLLASKLAMTSAPFAVGIEVGDDVAALFGAGVRAKQQGLGFNFFFDAFRQITGGVGKLAKDDEFPGCKARLRCKLALKLYQFWVALH